MRSSPTDPYPGIEDHRRADRLVWDRTKAQNLMTNWLSKGMKFDAVVSNNDEMAIGAIQAMKAAQRPTPRRRSSAASMRRRTRSLQ